jgi:hypothetical protein
MYNDIIANGAIAQTVINTAPTPDNDALVLLVAVIYIPPLLMGHGYEKTKGHTDSHQYAP